MADLIYFIEFFILMVVCLLAMGKGGDGVDVV